VVAPEKRTFSSAKVISISTFLRLLVSGQGQLQVDRKPSQLFTINFCLVSLGVLALVLIRGVPADTSLEFVATENPIEGSAFSRKRLATWSTPPPSES